MKLSSDARAFINTVLSDAEHGNEEIRVALTLAMSAKFVSDRVTNSSETENTKELTAAALTMLNAINQHLILAYDLDETVALVLRLVRWRSSVAGVGTYSPKSFESVTYPLAGILGLSGFVEDDVVKTMCHPKMLDYLAGWNTVIRCM